MDKAALKVLMELASDSDRETLGMCLAAVDDLTERCKARPDVDLLKKKAEAETLLAREAARIRAEVDPSSRVLANVLEVLAYLQETGWKASKSTLYQHKNENLFRPDRSGLFLASEIDRYASIHLERLDGSGQDNVDLARAKAEEELLRLQLQTQRMDLELQQRRGELMERATVNRALAFRAAVFRRDLQAFTKATAQDVIRACGGDATKAPDVSAILQKAVNAALGRYDSGQDFVATIENDAR